MTEPSWVGSDYEYLDPERPAVVYADELSPEEKTQDEGEIAALDERAAAGEHPGMEYLDSLDAKPKSQKKRRRGRKR